jgi:hypothetical protein
MLYFQLYYLNFKKFKRYYNLRNQVKITRLFLLRFQLKEKLEAVRTYINLLLSEKLG